MTDFELVVEPVAVPDCHRPECVVRIKWNGSRTGIEISHGATAFYTIAEVEALGAGDFAAGLQRLGRDAYGGHYYVGSQRFGHDELAELRSA